MPTYIGNDKLKSCYIGTDKVKKIYIGTDLVFSAGGNYDSKIPAGTVIKFNEILTPVPSTDFYINIKFIYSYGHSNIEADGMNYERPSGFTGGNSLVFDGRQSVYFWDSNKWFVDNYRIIKLTSDYTYESEDIKNWILANSVFE